MEEQGAGVCEPCGEVCSDWGVNIIYNVPLQEYVNVDCKSYLITATHMTTSTKPVFHVWWDNKNIVINMLMQICICV